MPGGFSSIAVRNAARLYDPVRRLPQMASTLVPLASLIRFSPGLPATPYRTSTVRARRSRGEMRDQVRVVPRGTCAAARLHLNISEHDRNASGCSEEISWLALTGEGF